MLWKTYSDPDNGADVHLVRKDMILRLVWILLLTGLLVFAVVFSA